MKVSQYMSRQVLTIAPQTEFHRAFDLMHSRRIHHLPSRHFTFNQLS